MPEEHRAESEIVRPKPDTAEAVINIAEQLAMATDFVAMTEGTSNGVDLIAGIEGGIALAIDHPEAARIVLAAFDDKKRQVSVERGEPEDEVAELDAQNRAARALGMRLLADAALGKISEMPNGVGFGTPKDEPTPFEQVAPIEVVPDEQAEVPDAFVWND